MERGSDCTNDSVSECEELLALCFSTAVILLSVFSEVFLVRILKY